MRLKQIALATLFAAATALPALAQTAPATTPPVSAKSPIAAPMTPAAKPAAAAPAAAATPAAKPGKIVKSTTAVVNINTGTSEELQVVKGIGKATAAKIIAGRPYKAVDDLDTKKVMSHSEFTKLKAQFTI
jgi:competence protein ComEA